MGGSGVFPGLPPPPGVALSGCIPVHWLMLHVRQMK